MRVLQSGLVVRDHRAVQNILVVGDVHQMVLDAVKIGAIISMSQGKSDNRNTSLRPLVVVLRMIC